MEHKTKPSLLARAPLVFVLNRGGHDYSPAERFGTITYVTEGIQSKYSTGIMFREIEAALSRSSPADYIVLSGLTTMCSIACAMFAYRHGILNLLIYRDGDYVARRLSFAAPDSNSPQ